MRYTSALHSHCFTFSFAESAAIHVEGSSPQQTKSILQRQPGFGPVGAGYQSPRTMNRSGQTMSPLLRAATALDSCSGWSLMPVRMRGINEIQWMKCIPAKPNDQKCGFCVSCWTVDSWFHLRAGRMTQHYVRSAAREWQVPQFAGKRDRTGNWITHAGLED